MNIFLFLSLFFSVTSALVSTLIQQWAREYLQYSQPSAAPHKRGRVRAYLFDGLSRFQMRRLTHGVPLLLHLAVFFFFYALSEWLLSINVPVGTTARYCLVALSAVYMALSVLPLIVRNAPYRTALDHTASGVCFTHSIFIHCPSSARAVLLDNLSSPQTFRSFQELTCRSSSNPHEVNPEERIGTGSICDALATARTR